MGVLEAIVEERRRQEVIGIARRADGFDWSSCADPKMTGGDTMRLAVLAEEFGEVARAVLESDGPGLVDELVQVAAVCAAWLESRGIPLEPFSRENERVAELEQALRTATRDLVDERHVREACEVQLADRDRRIAALREVFRDE